MAEPEDLQAPREEPEQQPLSSLADQLRGTPKGYVPIETNVPGQAQGSLWSANFRDSTAIGSFIDSDNARQLDPDENVTTEDLIANIPAENIDDAPLYLGIKLEDFPMRTETINRQREAKQLIAQHPYQSFAIGLVQQAALEPVNWLPFGAIYNNAKRTSRLAKSIIQSGATGVAAATVQEAIIQRNQITREAQESAFNIVASGLVGATLGGIGAGLTIRGKAKSESQITARKKLTSETMDVLTDKDIPLDADGLLTSEQIAKLPPALQKAMIPTPMNRLIKSEFGFSKWFGSTMYEHNYTLNKNLDGKTSEVSIERKIKDRHGRLQQHLIEYDNIYYDSIGVSRGVFKGTRAKLQGISGDTKTQFDTDVWTVLSTENRSASEHVNRAADLLRTEIFDPAKDRLIELGVLPENVRPRNAANYVMSVYNRDLIIEQDGKSARHAGSLPVTLHNEFRAVRDEVKIFKESPSYKAATANVLKQKESLSTLEAKAKLISKNKKAAIKKSKDAIKAAKEKLNEFEQNLKQLIPERLTDSDGNLRPVVDDAQLWTQVENTIDNILGDNDGKLLNPIMQRIKGIGADPAKARTMSVEQSVLREWQITNMGKIADLYSRATAPIIELTEFAQKHGAKDIDEFKANFEKQLNDEFDTRVAGKIGSEAQRLRKMRDDNIKDMNATFQLLEGVYGDGPNILNDSAKKYYQNFLKWNMTRLLGFMTMSSFPDAGIQVFTHGYYRFMHDGLLGTFTEARGIAKQDLRAIGYAMETALGTRIKSYADTQGLSTNPGPFTRGLDSLTKNFGNLSVMNQWNNLMQEMAGHIGINRTLQTVHKVVEGRNVPDKEILRLNKLGLERKHFKTIYEFTKNNNSDGTLFADWTKWDVRSAGQREALEQFQATVGKEIDNIVIVPGLGDKPLFARTPLGRVMLQFKSFLMAATNRVVMPGIQNRNDVNTYLGIVSMLSLGALSYVATSLVKGKEPDLSFENMAKESLDKSGLLGIYGEFYNIGAKTLGLGGTSRYQTRNAWGAWLGPTYGAGSEIMEMLAAGTDMFKEQRTPTSKEADKFMRLMPLQNLATTYELPKKLIKGGLKNLGAIEDVD